jgi:hypothetical protein
MQPNKDSKSASPFEVSNESLEALNAAVNQAAERSQAFMETGLRTWEREVARYFDELSEHGRATIEALGKCQTPMDVLTVEQQWLRSRAQSYLDTGMRFAQAFAEAAKTLPGEHPAPAKPSTRVSPRAAA